MTHLSFEQISELAERDGGTVADDATAHLANCEACRRSVARIRELLASASELPREVAPPPEVWSTVRGRVAEARASARTVRWWHNGWLAMAAAIVLVAGTMVVTTRVASRGKASKPDPMQAGNTPASAALFAVDKNYVVTIRELRATLDEQRSRLTPTTVQTVEHSLEVIDQAIAEARAALAADPGNQAIVGILAAHYERAVDLLQRATELSPSL